MSGLHAKLERKTKVEEHNQSTLEMFRDSFRENIDSMKNSLTNFSEGQVMASSEVKNSLGEYNWYTKQIINVSSNHNELDDSSYFNNNVIITKLYNHPS